MRIGHAHDHHRVLEHGESRTQRTKGEVAVNVYIKLGSRSTRVFIAVAVTVLFLCLQSCSAAPSSPPIPGEPPLGWQQEITEGFDPPIERIFLAGLSPGVPLIKGSRGSASSGSPGRRRGDNSPRDQAPEQAICPRIIETDDAVLTRLDRDRAAGVVGHCYSRWTLVLHNYRGHDDFPGFMLN